MKFRDLGIFILILTALSLSAFGQGKPVSEQLADTAMNRIWVDARNQPGIPPKWNYEQGVILKAIEADVVCDRRRQIFSIIFKREWTIGSTRTAITRIIISRNTTSTTSHLGLR